MTLSFGVYFIGDEGNHGILDKIQRIREQSGTVEAVGREIWTRLDANNITDVEKKSSPTLLHRSDYVLTTDGLSRSRQAHRQIVQ